MARPRLPLGTAGSITVQQHKDKPRGKRWRAYSAVRDLDGQTRQVERWGESSSAAKARLAEAIRDRIPPTHTGLSSRSRFADAAEKWMHDVEKRCAIRTIQTYRAALDRHVLPALGEIQLGELNQAHLNLYMQELASRAYSANTRRTIKSVISGVLEEALAHRAVFDNSTKKMRRITDNSRKVRALTAPERTEFLTRLDDLRCAHHLDAPSTRAETCKMCRTARGDVPDLVRFMLGTGVRLGEALAMRWCDLQLDGEPVTAAVGPTLVRQPGNGLVRQDEGKTKAATRTILLPGVVVTMLASRRPLAATDEDPVFPSTAHTWWDPASASKALRKARDRTGFDWVTSHVFRKTAATVLDDAGLSARQIADQLGHTRPSMTQDVYMGRGAPNPAAASALDRAYGMRD